MPGSTRSAIRLAMANFSSAMRWSRAMKSYSRLSSSVSISDAPP
jgi:hypothetical protein